MSDNIVAIYGDVPELVEKQSAEIISQFLKSDRDDFNFVKYNLYETEIAPIVEETLTLPFFSDKKAILVKNAYIFTGEKAPKDMAHNVNQLIEFIEKYDGENLIVFEIYQNLSLIHISEPTRLRCISYAVFCLKKTATSNC
ncbi:hypothetical protein JMUB7523_14880 [Staphylococcus aureus]